MTRKEKLLAKAMRGATLSFREFETLLRQSGWTLCRTKGSHRLWLYPKTGKVIPVTNVMGEAVPYQVKQFLLEMENANGL